MGGPKTRFPGSWRSEDSTSLESEDSTSLESEDSTWLESDDSEFEDSASLESEDSYSDSTLLESDSEVSISFGPDSEISTSSGSEISIPLGPDSPEGPCHLGSKIPDPNSGKEVQSAQKQLFQSGAVRLEATPAPAESGGGPKLCVRLCDADQIDERLHSAITSNDSVAVIDFLQKDGELQNSKVVLRVAADNQVSPDIMRRLLTAAGKNILDWFTELDNC